MTNNFCRVITWNINSILVRRLLLKHLFETTNPDVILLQEIRVSDINKHKISHFDKYPYMYFSLSSDKGYAGVGILSKFPLKIVYEYKSRVLIGYSEKINLYFCSIYMYNGFSTTAPLEKKISLLNKLMDDLSSFKDVIIGGDMNVCHDNECHLYPNPYTEIEKKLLSDMQDIYVPIFDDQKHITWWDYRMRSFEKNIGLGIDKFLVKLSRKYTANCKILKKYRENVILGVIPSDHAPLLLNLEIFAENMV